VTGRLAACALLAVAVSACGVTRAATPRPLSSSVTKDAAVRPYVATTRAARTQATTPVRRLPARALLRLPAVSQLPELGNGCEVTSLAMLLTAAHHPVDKLSLAAAMPRDPTPPSFDGAGRGFTDVTRWGDPEAGFVGNVHGTLGYAIHHVALARFLDSVIPGRSRDLTGAPVATLLRRVASGTPVLMWTTATFTPTQNWVVWQSPHGPVRAPSDEHAVLLVGYDRRHLYVNDPLTGTAARAVDRDSFLAAWTQLGRQALSYD